MRPDLAHAIIFLSCLYGRSRHRRLLGLCRLFLSCLYGRSLDDKRFKSLIVKEINPTCLVEANLHDNCKSLISREA